ncbi:hypothetical protein BB561_000068 [Smittium simulii]|uniref:CCAAT-binding factor domain-containing protein n=1 Tax=Smittium simulii TaxID=133385 RepID=A0A2T9Z0X0_9FUNG|nr:hypothetical protein BB561_000068 [Smittium simulii]
MTATILKPSSKPNKAKKQGKKTTNDNSEPRNKKNTEQLDSKDELNNKELQLSIKEFAASIGLNPEAPSLTNVDLKKKGRKSKNISEKKQENKQSSQKSIPKPSKNNENVFKKDSTTKFEKNKSSNPISNVNTKNLSVKKEANQSNNTKNVPLSQKAPTKIIFDDSGKKNQVSQPSIGSQALGQKNRLLLDPTIMWYNVALPEITSVELDNTLNNSEALAKSEAYAMSLLQNENNTYDRMKKQGKNSRITSNDMDFVSSILHSGTLSDKISALTLLVQESPIYNIASINTLVGMTKKKHRKEAIMAVSSLKDLLVNNLLPDRKLVYYADRPWNADNITLKCYILWIFEDLLKKAYFDLIKVIEELLFDTVEHTRTSMLVHVESLLESKPEQEQNLLRLLVTKLGDKEKKVASKVMFLILQLLNTHPNMKAIVIKTVQELLLSRKKAGAERSQYYSMITLNQIILTSKDTQAANTLIDAYLNVNKAYYGRNAMIKSKDTANDENESELKSLENRMMAAILTGLNRSLPFSNLSAESWKEYADILFKVSHSTNFNVVVQTLLFLLQLTQNGTIDSQRFYRTLYDSLLDPRIELSSKQGLYLNLMFKSLEVDHNTNRVQAFVRRMLQISLYHSTPFVCGILYIISEIAYSKPKIRSLWKSNPEQLESNISNSNKDDQNEHADDEISRTESKYGSGYDPIKREPEYSNAQNSLCWEAITLVKHYHPTLSLQVLKLLNGDRLEKATNLHLHSLSHFLDRFVYRKPKQDTVQRGISIMQPNLSENSTSLADHNTLGSNKLLWSKDSNLVDSKSFILINKKLVKNISQLSEINLEGVEVDSENASDSTAVAVKNKAVKFLPKYLMKSKKSKKSKNSDEFSDDLPEDEVWKAISADEDGEEIGNDSRGNDFKSFDDEISDTEFDSTSNNEHDDTGSYSDSGDSDDDIDLVFNESPKKGGKRNLEQKPAKNNKSNKRQKRDKLPMIASFDDYAALIDG